MKLSINIDPLLKRYKLEECIDLYQKAGYDCMDYPFFAMIHENCIYNTAQYREAAREVRAVSDAKGFPVNQTHAPFAFKQEQWLNPVCYEEFIFPAIVRSIEASGILGADTVVVHPIHHIAYKGHEEELFQRNMEFYGKLIPYAKEAGVKVAVENMWQRDPLRNCIIADTCSEAEEFVRYIDALDSEQITACLDVGHVGLPVSASRSVGDVIRALGHDRLGALHIHDNDFQGDLHLLPYLGKLDWDDITKALGEINYKGDFTYEVGGQLTANLNGDFADLGAAFGVQVGRHLMAKIDANRPV